MHTDYLNPAIRQLGDQQVRFAPREKQIAQVDSAEELLNDLDPERTDRCQHVCCRLTNDRAESYPDIEFTGKEARHDLRLFVEDLSDAASVPVATTSEHVLTVDELASQFQVSTKTVCRWRQRGLVSQQFLLDGRKRVGFLQSSVDRFVAQNEQRVRRGAQFSQLTQEARTQIIERARHLAQAGGCPAEVIKRLAQEMGRSVETIRYTLKRFDLKHPDLAIFPYYHSPLRAETKWKIYQQYRRGESVEALARRFCQNRASIYRIIHAMHAARITELPLGHISNEQFVRLRSEKKEGEILGPLPESDLGTSKSRVPSGVPPYLAGLYEVPLLTCQQEVHLFRKMNYLKYKASKLREKLDLNQPSHSLMGQIEKLYDESVATKNRIVRANLRLVVSIAKRYVGPVTDFSELVSDGNMSLIRAVEKFDFSRGNKFSTYATWAITRNFARTIPDALRHRDRFRTSQSEMLSTAGDHRADPYEQESVQNQWRSQVERILQRLDQRERQIVAARFGLPPGQEPLTLKQLGAVMGVTKERIRQIEARAMRKLRTAAEQNRIERPV